jgi:hypothetical protein
MPELSTTVIVPWNLISEGLPEYGIEVLGYHKLWIDEDYNIDGIRICYKTDMLDEEDNPVWVSAAWCGYHDEWHTISTDDIREEGDKTGIDKNVAPTHWMPKPTSPN